MANKKEHKGLTKEEIDLSRRQYGSNVLELEEERVFFHVLKGVVLEPMFILLLIACIIYFLLQEYREGIILLVAIFIVSGISFYQEYRSRNAILALKKLSAAKSTVIRERQICHIPADEIVVNDILIVEEGEIIPADGKVIASNDFSVNESILTGETFPVFKNADNNDNVYRSTLVTSGSATVEVNEVGLKTMFGKIGTSLQSVKQVKTPMQNQVRLFVQRMLWFGIIAFVFVFGIHFYQTADFSYALLQGLTLAMSVLPEEIPVAFSTFQALGAFRLLRNHIIVKQPQFVETLGSATVICVDKTGTITENRMEINFLYDVAVQKLFALNGINDVPERLIEYAMWASETEPFDPMEIAIHELYQKTDPENKRTQFEQIHEYPVSGRPPMMTHIFRNGTGTTIIACKGAPEGMLRQSNLPLPTLKKIEEQASAFAKEGYRVLGVAKGIWHEKKFPLSQQEFAFEFLGLIAFNDPPKANISATIKKFHDAGIQVKMITGDYAETAVAISKEINLDSGYKFLTGEEVLHLDKDDLKQKVNAVHIFARMFPEAKLKVIDALKENGEVVAMTGDGVNDAPALKAAHIGIAMGQRGSEVARNAASLIITDDDLSHMTDAVALGRKIYSNLKKAIQYIVSIHIPIILIVTLPLLFAWNFTDIFSPVHVIFLELIMGPTCSIIYENEPVEKGIMQRMPKKSGGSFLTNREWSLSVLQGLAITAGCLGLGYYYIKEQYDPENIRSLIFITLLFSNVFLTLVNRSFRYTIFTTIRYKNKLLPLIIFITLLFIVSLLYLPFLQDLFRLTFLSYKEILLSVAVAFAGTFWMEILKILRRNQ